VVEREIFVGDATFSFLMVRDTNRLLDEIDSRTFAVDERLPYWAELWPAAVALARFCLEEKTVKGGRVLELGCGLGLAGIAAARAGARVTMTDYEVDALLFARYNAERNLEREQRARIEFALLDWRDPADLGRYDVIIAADVIYERRNFIPLLHLIDTSLAAGGVAHFADPDRSIGKSFRGEALSLGFTVAEHTSLVDIQGKTHSIVRYAIGRHPECTDGEESNGR
jgi:predicted nicotinamide N-methyase